MDEIKEENPEAYQDPIISEPLPSECRMWVKRCPFVGPPRWRNFQMQSAKLPPLQEGEILIQALCWTVDPYMRIFNTPEGSVIQGDQVGSVLESRHKDYPTYSLVITSGGWQTHAILDPNQTHVTLVPILGQLPLSLCLGTIGYPGLLAYIAIQQCGDIRSGSVVLLNAASGPIANVIGQLAKLKGATVIAFCKSYEQATWLRYLGFDFVFNSPNIKPSSALKWVVPSGVDFYFDNAGASFTSAIIPNLKDNATVCLFGYCHSTLFPDGVDLNPYHVMWKKGGDFCTDNLFNYKHQFGDIQSRLIALIVEGKLKYREKVLQGFEQIPEALISMYTQPTVGKTIIAASNTSLQTVLLEYLPEYQHSQSMVKVENPSCGHLAVG